MNYQLLPRLAAVISEAVEVLVEQARPQPASKEFLFDLSEQWLKARGKIFLVDDERFAAHNPGYDGYALAMPGTVVASNLCDDLIDPDNFRIAGDLRNEVEVEVVAFKLARSEERAPRPLVQLLVLGRMVASGRVRYKKDRDGAAVFYISKSRGIR
ncbi:MAG: hypothetical protein IPK23_15760 [Rhizobiales bacterium]|nr:hypothetical protein [Hyphomicrobiales bacterium]